MKPSKEGVDLPSSEEEIAVTELGGVGRLLEAGQTAEEVFLGDESDVIRTRRLAS